MTNLNINGLLNERKVDIENRKADIQNKKQILEACLLKKLGISMIDAAII
jgi:hypothetical protein